MRAADAMSGGASSASSIPGFYYDGKTAGRTSAYMVLDESGMVRFDGLNIAPLAFTDIVVPSRLGNTPRTLRLPNGGLFETSANAQLDAVAKRFSRRRSQSWSLHRFERTPWLIMVLLVLALGMGYLMVDKAIPYASEQLAYNLPVEWSEGLAENTMRQLDEYYFSPSALPEATQTRYRELFQQYLPADTEFNYQLYFRQGDMIGANAFALPGGQIIVTDELIALAEHEHEVLSVLLHELGHVEHRHSLRAVLESTGVAVLFMLFAGDAEHVMELVVAAPAMLLQAAFSRDHEWEADTYSLERMQAADLDPIHFARIMQRLTAAGASAGGSESETEHDHAQVDGEGREVAHRSEHDEAASDQEHVTEGETEADSSMLRYLSTHPMPRARIERFERASQGE